MERLYTRREALKLFSTTLLAGVAPPFHQLMSQLERPTFSVYGLHGTPDLGGGVDSELLVSDLINLGAKWLVSLDPSEELLQRIKSSNIGLIIRTSEPENTFTPDYQVSLLKKYQKYIPNLVIQPFNEVNLLAETGGKVIPAPEHISKSFIPTAELISEYGGLTLITPLAQRTSYPNFEELPYYIESLRQLKKAKDISWILNNLALGVHSYIFTPGEDQWRRVSILASAAQQILEVNLPIFITESGLYQTRQTNFSQELVARETIRQLETPVPYHLPIQSNCFCDVFDKGV